VSLSVEFSVVVNMLPTLSRSLKKTRVELVDLETSQMVLVNYNFESPLERGYWYDAVVSSIKITSTAKSLLCSITVGKLTTILKALWSAASGTMPWSPA
jgi:hypothetical protein